MSNINELNQCPCDKLDPRCVDAYFSYNLAPENPTVVEFENSWGVQTLDLAPAIAVGETVTTLELTDTALQFNGEKDTISCISGDDLSGIISLSKLKDVSQTAPIADGETYVWNATQGVFEPFQVKGTGTAGDIAALQASVASLQTQANSLQTAVAQLQEAIKELSGESPDISKLQEQVAALQTSVSALQTATAKPSYAPSDAALVWGTTNSVASAYAGKGLYSHNPATNVQGDTEFSA